MLAGNSTRAFSIPSSGCGIPSTAKAFSLNSTVQPFDAAWPTFKGEALGFMTVFPTGSPRPVVSTLNNFTLTTPSALPVGKILANGGIFASGTSGSVNF